MTRKLLAIGVGTVEPVDGEEEDFPYLDGAVVAAETIGDWAIKSGFAPDDVIVLTDKGADKVTSASLEQSFTRLLPAGTVTEHFILAFAGHGMTGLNDDITYWLMSDSLQQGYQIFVEDLKRELYFYGIEHLTIFSDACRAIANTRNLQRLTPRPGVTRRHGPRTEVDLARYNACQDATSSFMVRETGAAAPGKCIFSGVLAEALWGRVPAAFDGKVIDSSSLGRGLKNAVRARAAQYNETLVPSGNPFFDKVIFYDKDLPPLPPDPDFPPWPPAGIAQSIGVGPPPIPVIVQDHGVDTAAQQAAVKPINLPRGGEMLETAGEPDFADTVFTNVLGNAKIRTDILGVGFGESHLDIDTHRSFPGLPRAAKPIVADVAILRHAVDNYGLSNIQMRGAISEIDQRIESLEGLAARRARMRKAKNRTAAVRRVSRAPDTQGANLAVNAPVAAIWSDGVAVRSHHSRGGFQLAEPHAPSLLMIEFVDGLFAPVCHYPGLFCSVVRDHEGVAVISYRPESGPDEGAEAVEAAAARLVTGKLTRDELDQLATRLRHAKHANPIFGAIAAYCYDLTGDLDSITRMAFYYAGRGQPVPYDIAFMGMLESNGQIVDIPPVRRDRRRTGRGLPEWLTAETPSAHAPIAGRCPWLRQGWDFVSTPEDEERPLVTGLEEVRRDLQPSIFTTLNAKGGNRLIDRWSLSKCRND